ncbi:hypothetical protein ACS8E3_08750 [Psychrobacter sp. 2Y5]|uniref:hypothetical protein n=1 Tax=unclassified Psychrobacter TaxID=196806 RepID=UPI003F47B426
MATLYQLHSTMDNLRRSTDQLALTWRSGDSLILLGTTVAFIDWLTAYLTENQIEGIANLYALADDISQLDDNTITKLTLQTKIDAVLGDADWVKLTQDHRFDKVVTIAL